MIRKMNSQQLSMRNKKKKNHKHTKKKVHEPDEKKVQKPTFFDIFPTDLKRDFKLDKTERQLTIDKFKKIRDELNEQANKTRTEASDRIRKEPSTEQEQVEPRTSFRDNNKEI